MEVFKFTNQPDSYESNGSFIAQIENINNEDYLFKELSEKLKFPDYFGYNWNAVYDCLCDLSWIQEREVVLIHLQPLNISRKTFKVYLEVLSDAVKSWENDTDKILIVIFPSSDRQEILECLNETS